MAEDSGLNIKVRTYYGVPYDVDNVPTRHSTYRDEHVPKINVINDPFGDAVIDITRHAPSLYTFDDLVADFQDEYGCKVSYSETDGNVREIDVFEPSWVDPIEAADVAGDLTQRVLDFMYGHPTGR